MTRRDAARPLGMVFAVSVLIALSSAGAAAAEIYCKHYEGPDGSCLLRGGNEHWECNPPTDGKCYSIPSVGNKFTCECLSEPPKNPMPQLPRPPAKPPQRLPEPEQR
jgi:hypothetical protein